MPTAELTTWRAEMLRAEYRDDARAGTTAYRISSPDVIGVFVIIPAVVDDQGRIDPDRQQVRIDYGHHPWFRVQPQRRLDKPQIDGWELEGSPVISLDLLRCTPRTAWTPAPVAASLGQQHHRSGTNHAPVPEAVSHHAAEIVEALLRHWWARPESYALRLQTAQALSGRRKDMLHSMMREAVDRYAAARCDLIALEQEIDAADTFSSVEGISCDPVPAVAAQ